MASRVSKMKQLSRNDSHVRGNSIVSDNKRINGEHRTTKNFVIKIKIIEGIRSLVS